MTYFTLAAMMMIVRIVFWRRPEGWRTWALDVFIATLLFLGAFNLGLEYISDRFAPVTTTGVRI